MRHALVWVGLTLGCHKTVVLDGVIVDGANAAAGVQKPLEGALAIMTCPEGKTREREVAANASGHVRFVLGSRIHRACTLDVKLTGYEPARFVIGDVCPKHEEEPSAPYCGTETVVVVRLMPIGARPTPAAP